MAFLECARNFLKWFNYNNRAVKTSVLMNDLVLLYAVCNIDFQKHHQFIHNHLQPSSVQDDMIDGLIDGWIDESIHVLTDHSVVQTLWHNLTLEIIDMFEFLLCNPVLVKKHVQVVNHLVTKVVNQYINTMVLVVEKCTVKLGTGSLSTITGKLFDPIYIYIHGVFLIPSSTAMSIDPFYQSKLIQTRYALPPSVNHMIAVNHDCVLTVFQSIMYKTSPAGKLSSIQSTIDIINNLYRKSGLLSTTDELIASLANVIYRSKVPFILVELQFCKTFLSHVFPSNKDGCDSDVIFFTKHPRQIGVGVGKMYFCFTTFEATLVDIMIHI